MSQSLRDPSEELLDYVWRVGRGLAWLDNAKTIVSRAASVLREIAGEVSLVVYLAPSPGEDISVPPHESPSALRAAVESQLLLEGLGSIEDLLEAREFRLARDSLGDLHGLLLPLRTAKAFWGSLAVLGPEPFSQWLDHLEEFAACVAGGLKWAASLESRQSTPSPGSAPIVPGRPRATRFPRSLPPRGGGNRLWGSLEDLLVQWRIQPISGLVVFDERLHVVASAPHPDDALVRLARQSIEDRHLTRGPVPPASDAPVEVTSEDHCVLLIPASLGEDLLGIVAACVEADRRSEAASAVADLSQLVAIELFVRDRIAQEVEADEREVFLDLLDGRGLGRIVYRAARLGCDLTVEHLPVAFRLVRPSRHANPERQMGCLRTILLESFRADAASARPLCGQTETNEILAFLPISQERAADLLARRVLRATKSLGAVVAGIGPMCSSPAAFSRNALRAQWTAKILELTGSLQCAGSFDELGVYALLFDPADPTELEMFVARWIGPLVAYDRQQNTELTATLETILEGRGQRQTAERLLIHLSTLKYRIRRIHEILRLNFQDPEISFNLQLALRIFKAREKLSGASDESVEPESGEPSFPWRITFSSTC